MRESPGFALALSRFRGAAPLRWTPSVGQESGSTARVLGFRGAVSPSFAIGALAFDAASTAVSLSGLSVTAPAGVQFLVWRLQRRGLDRRACW